MSTHRPTGRPTDRVACARTCDSTTWGSRGRRFKSCRPDGKVAGQRPFPSSGGDGLIRVWAQKYTYGVQVYLAARTRLTWDVDRQPLIRRAVQFGHCGGCTFSIYRLRPAVTVARPGYGCGPGVISRPGTSALAIAARPWWSRGCPGE
jgi:hypothetical protein